MSLEINFDIPDKSRDLKSLGFKIDATSLDTWRSQLPLTNAGEAASLFLERVQNINRTRIGTTDHFNALQHLQALAIEITETLRGRYSRAMLPLNERNMGLHYLATRIYIELSVGFKSVLMEAMASHIRSTENLKIMVQCLYWSLHNISLLMLEYYLIYAPIPAHCWEESNAQYQFAEKHQLENISIRPDTPNEESGTISFTYKRTLLLSLSNPYHLMMEEAATLFNLLEKLAHVIQIYLVRTEEVMQNGFIVDLQSDAGPCFISAHHKVQSFEPRSLDLAKLIAVVKLHISKLLEAQKKNDKAGKSSLMLRMQRDLLTRLVASWGRTSERVHERTAIFGKVDITVGLSSTHHNLSGGNAFTPELDEIQLHTGGLKSGSHQGLSLSLIPKEVETWRLEEAQKRADAGIDVFRQSHFDDQSNALDTWSKIYPVKPSGQRPQDADGAFMLEQRFMPTSWEIQNVSEGGMSLHCQIGKCAPVRVGEIIAYREDHDGEDLWVLGTIRWLHAHLDKTLNMGILYLARVMLPVAVRAIKGIGKGGEYMRAIVINSLRLDDPEACLIVPASLYDTGSQLAINLKDRIEYVELTEFVIGTKSFAQYHIRLIARPESEVENIRRLRDLI